MVLPVQQFQVPTPEQMGHPNFNVYLSQALKNAQAAQQVPYAGRTAAAELNLKNAQASQAGSSAQLNQLKLKYPGFGESGIIGQLAYMQFLRDNPALAQQYAALNNQQQNNIPQQTSQFNPSIQNNQELNIPGMGGMTGSDTNPISQALMQKQQMQQNINNPSQIQNNIPQQIAYQMNRQNNQAQSNEINPIDILRRSIEANIANQQSLANWRSTGGFGSSRYAPAVQKNISAFENQLKADHPEWDDNTVKEAESAYLLGSDEINGEKLPSLSGNAATLRQAIFKSNSTASIQNQAASSSETAQEFNDIDITPLKRFAGLKGKLDIAKYKTMMASGQPIPQEARDYISFQNVTSNFAMDSLRKGFGTSVVPGYVYATLGNASNPGSTWWDDPKQVENDWSKTLQWINKNADIYKDKAEHGATSTLKENNNKNSVTKRSRWVNGKLETIS